MAAGDFTWVELVDHDGLDLSAAVEGLPIHPALLDDPLLRAFFTHMRSGLTALAELIADIAALAVFRSRGWLGVNREHDH